MKNITVSVPDEVYQNAREYAAKKGKSVSAVVRERLIEVSEHAKQVEALNAFWEKLDRERANGPHLDASNLMTREELYDEALGRHKHPSL